MISSAIFMESLAISSSLSRNIPASTLGLPFLVKKMTAQPTQEVTGRFIQTTKNEVILPTQSHQPMHAATTREPLKPTTTTIKRKCDMSGRVSYSISSQGQTNNKDTLGAVEKLPVAGLVGGGWTLDWCRLIEIVAASYFDHGPNNSEKSYVDKTFYRLYDLDIPAIRERVIYSTENGVNIARGRIDLEVWKKYLLEYKIVEPSPNQIRKDSKQLYRYLITYHEFNAPIEKAALIYLFGGEVRVVEVSLQTDKNRFTPY